MSDEGRVSSYLVTFAKVYGQFFPFAPVIYGKIFIHLFSVETPWKKENRSEENRPKPSTALLSQRLLHLRSR